MIHSVVTHKTLLTASLAEKLCVMLLVREPTTCNAAGRSHTIGNTVGKGHDDHCEKCRHRLIDIVPPDLHDVDHHQSPHHNDRWACREGRNRRCTHADMTVSALNALSQSGRAFGKVRHGSRRQAPCKPIGAQPLAGSDHIGHQTLQSTPYLCHEQKLLTSPACILKCCLNNLRRMTGMHNSWLLANCWSACATTHLTDQDRPAYLC